MDSLSLILAFESGVGCVLRHLRLLETKGRIIGTVSAMYAT